MFVKTWMKSPAILLIADVTVGWALDHLKRQKACHAVVISRGHVLGAVSTAELRDADRDLDGFSIRPHSFLGDILPKTARTVSPHDPLEKAAGMLLAAEASALPVVDEGRVVGVLAGSDVLRAVLEIFGAREHGARLVVTVSRGADLLEEIRRRSCGLGIRSLAARVTEGGGWEVALRLRGRGAAEERPARDPGICA